MKAYNALNTIRRFLIGGAILAALAIGFFYLNGSTVTDQLPAETEMVLSASTLQVLPKSIQDDIIMSFGLEDANEIPLPLTYITLKNKPVLAFQKSIWGREHAFVSASAGETTPYENGVLWEESFNSIINKAQRGNWTFVSADRPTLESILSANQTLAQHASYKKMKTNVAQKTAMTVFLRDTFFETASANVATQYQLLLAGAKDIVHGAIVTVQAKGPNVHIRAKTMFKESPVQQTRQNKPTASRMPALANFIPEDSTGAIIGIHLADQLEYIAQFLETINPEMGTFFSAALNGETEAVFGTSFDLQKDLLDYTQGEFAVIYDTPTDGTPTPITFIAQTTDSFSSTDFQEKLKQSPLLQTSELREITLPDGTIREEFILSNSNNTTIEQETLNGARITTLPSETDATSLVFAEKENVLIISSSRDAVVKIIADTPDKLAQNNDFVQAVTETFAPSAGYGFISGSGLREIRNSFLATKDEEPSAVTQSVRNIVFAQKSFGNEIFWDFVLFPR